jgi:hypothetical protein
MINNSINSILKSDDKSKFNFFIITILLLVFINKINIKPKHIIALIVSFFIIYYIKNEEKNSLNNESLIQNEKKNLIVPKIDKIKNYKDILNFVFSIQDLSKYNPQTYEEFIINLELFLQIYENTKVDEKFFTQYYHIAKQVKDECINKLYSIIYNLSDKIEVRNKLENAVDILKEILNNYIEELFKICKDKLKKNGYNNKITPLNKGFKPFNLYINEDYMYNII